MARYLNMQAWTSCTDLLCSGILVVYLIILGDIAVGSPPKYDGLLSTWFGLDAGKTWFLARPFVVGTSLDPLQNSRRAHILAPA